MDSVLIQIVRFKAKKATAEKIDLKTVILYLFIFWNNDMFAEISSTCFASDMHYKSSRK